MDGRLWLQIGCGRPITFAGRPVTLHAILFVNHPPSADAGFAKFRTCPGLVVLEVWHPLHHEIADYGAELRLCGICQKLPAMRDEVLGILPETKQPILVVSLAGSD